MILQIYAFEKKATKYFITVYSKLIKNPLAMARPGNIRLNIIKASPEYIKSVTSGDTIEVAIIPTGAKLPNNLRETGAVKSWAPVEEPRDEAK